MANPFIFKKANFFILANMMKVFPLYHKKPYDRVSINVLVIYSYLLRILILQGFSYIE